MAVSIRGGADGEDHPKGGYARGGPTAAKALVSIAVFAGRLKSLVKKPEETSKTSNARWQGLKCLRENPVLNARERSRRPIRLRRKPVQLKKQQVSAALRRRRSASQR